MEGREMNSGPNENRMVSRDSLSERQSSATTAQNIQAAESQAQAVAQQAQQPQSQSQQQGQAPQK